VLNCDLAQEYWVAILASILLEAINGPLEPQIYQTGEVIVEIRVVYVNDRAG
jgi:hypothetical protein